MYKILAFADAGGNTGFERVQRGILSYLQSTGHYEVVLYGLGWNGNPDFEYPYKVYPANQQGEYFGFDALPKICNKHQPDVIWCVQDLWHHLQYCVRKPVDIPYIGYFPVDSPNMKWSYGLSAGCMSAPVAYTQFGATEAAASIRDGIDLLYAGATGKGLDVNEKRQWISLPHPESNYKLNCRLDYLAKWQNPSEWSIVPHGIDLTHFYPMDKKEARKLFELDEDAFIVGSVNTNQFRKQQDRTMRAFAMLLDSVPNAKLLLYCNNSGEGGYDLHQAAQLLGIHKHTYFVHDFVNEMDDTSMNALYNSCDVMINTSGGEGWGLTSMEGAACGVPQMVPDWSATRELWKNHGLLIPVQDFRMKEGFLNTCLAEIDVEIAGNTLIALANNPDKLARYGTLARSLALAQPSWTAVGKQFEFIVRKTMGTFCEPEKMSLQSVLDARQGVVASELKNALYMKNGKPVYRRNP